MSKEYNNKLDELMKRMELLEAQNKAKNEEINKLNAKISQGNVITRKDEKEEKEIMRAVDVINSEKGKQVLTDIFGKVFTCEEWYNFFTNDDTTSEDIKNFKAYIRYNFNSTYFNGKPVATRAYKAVRAGEVTREDAYTLTLCQVSLRVIESYEAGSLFHIGNIVKSVLNKRSYWYDKEHYHHDSKGNIVNDVVNIDTVVNNMYMVKELWDDNGTLDRKMVTSSHERAVMLADIIENQIGWETFNELVSQLVVKSTTMKQTKVETVENHYNLAGKLIQTKKEVTVRDYSNDINWTDNNHEETKNKRDSETRRRRKENTATLERLAEELRKTNISFTREVITEAIELIHQRRS